MTIFERIKQYFKWLWLALKWVNTHDYYGYDYKFPVVRDLDYYIVYAVREILPYYNEWHPANITEEEWNKIKNRLIELANKLTSEDSYDYTSQGEKAIEEEIRDQKEFSELLWKYLFNLWD